MRMTLLLPVVAALAVATNGPIDIPSSAVAKPMNRCQIRHADCTTRCVMRSENKTQAQVNGCIRRTCDHQLRSCSANTAASAKEGSGRTREKVVRDKRRRLNAVPGTTAVSRSAPNGSAVKTGNVRH